MFRRIFVGFDGSAGSRRALQTAIALAREHRAVLSAVTVQHHLPRCGAATGEVDEELHVDEQQKLRLSNEVEALAAEQGVTACSLVRLGYPAQEIIRAAREGDADLIVIGRGARSSAYQRLMGGIAEKISRQALCSVLIVR